MHSLKWGKSMERTEIEQIIERFGIGFYESVWSTIEVCAEKWSLTSFHLISSNSNNLVFRCRSETFGSVVLKLHPPSSDEIRTEFHTLRQYNGNRFCRAYDADFANGVLLEEYVHPGTPLRKESSLDQRLSVFCSLYHGLHVKPENANLFPSYMEWVTKITEYMSGRQDGKALYLHMRKAREICSSVSTVYSQRMLLHGDLHHDNILLGPNGAYTIIDPKGVIGDPVFDIPRFIMNEFEDEITEELYRKISYVIRVLSEKLHVSLEIIKQCLYVETVMGVCWCVEDGSPADEFPRLLSKVEFAEAIMNS